MYKWNLHLFCRFVFSSLNQCFCPIFVFCTFFPHFVRNEWTHSAVNKSYRRCFGVDPMASLVADEMAIETHLKCGNIRSGHLFSSPRPLLSKCAFIVIGHFIMLLVIIIATRVNSGSYLNFSRSFGPSMFVYYIKRFIFIMYTAQAIISSFSRFRKSFQNFRRPRERKRKLNEINYPENEKSFFVAFHHRSCVCVLLVRCSKLTRNTRRFDKPFIFRRHLFLARAHLHYVRVGQMSFARFFVLCSARCHRTLARSLQQHNSLLHTQRINLISAVQPQQRLPIRLCRSSAVQRTPLRSQLFGFGNGRTASNNVSNTSKTE